MTYVLRDKKKSRIATQELQTEKERKKDIYIYYGQKLENKRYIYITDGKRGYGQSKLAERSAKKTRESVCVITV